MDVVTVTIEPDVVPTIPSPILDKPYGGLNLDPQTSASCVLTKPIDIYREEFFPIEHFNWLSADPLNPFVLSVVKQEDGNCKGLIINAKGDERFLLDLSAKTMRSATKKLAISEEEVQLHVDADKGISIALAMNPKFAEMELIPAFSKDFSSELLTIEQKHSQGKTTMKLGVIYCKKGQVTGADMFGNGSTASPLFWNFVNEFGQKFDLEGWTKYRGDMRPPGTAWYDLWQNVEVVCHVAPVMGPEEIRRLIGNDIGLVFFFDEPYDVPNPAKFDCSGIDTFGEVPCVFAVAQPNSDGTNFNVAFFSKKAILKTLPDSPSTPQNLAQTKQYIFTKLYHGLCKTIYCPPMNRLFLVPRRATLAALLEKWIPICQAEQQKNQKSVGDKVFNLLSKPKVHVKSKFRGASNAVIKSGSKGGTSTPKSEKPSSKKSVLTSSAGDLFIGDSPPPTGKKFSLDETNPNAFNALAQSGLMKKREKTPRGGEDSKSERSTDSLGGSSRSHGSKPMTRQRSRSRGPDEDRDEKFYGALAQSGLFKGSTQRKKSSTDHSDHAVDKSGHSSPLLGKKIRFSSFSTGCNECIIWKSRKIWICFQAK